MPFTTWIRDLFGIRKDVIDSKKAKLEIKKLEDEERERSSLINPASFDDVKKYDPNVQRLELEIPRARQKRGYGSAKVLVEFAKRSPRITGIAILLTMIIFVIAVIRSCVNFMR